MRNLALYRYISVIYFTVEVHLSYKLLLKGGGQIAHVNE